MTWESWVLFGIVMTSIIVITIALFSQLGDTPTQRAEKELKRLADDYYVLYLYPRLIGSKKTAEEALKIYDDAGVPTVFLRQMLHFNDDENIESAVFFENLKCNTNTTGVRYYPVEPYGPRDYTVDYIWHCDI